MSPASPAHPPATAPRPVRVLIKLLLALSLTSVACGSSEPKTTVMGEVEVNGGSEAVQLIEAVCIRNTPAQEPC